MDLVDLKAVLESRADAAPRRPLDPAPVVARVIRLRRRRRVAAAASIIASVAAAALAVTLTSTTSSGRQTLIPAGPAPSAPPSKVTAPQAFSPVQVPWSGFVQTGHLVAAVGAGHERLAEVDPQTGQVVRYLQLEGDHTLGLRFDRSLVDPGLPDGSCRYTYKAITGVGGSLSYGRHAPSLIPLAGIGELANAASSGRYAYGQRRPAGSYSGRLNGRQTTIRAGCGGTPIDLVVVDAQTGRKRVWSATGDGELFVDSLQATFDSESLHIAYDLAGSIRVLDINGAEKRLDQAPALPLPPGCFAALPDYQPRSETLWVAETCPDGRYVASFNAVTRAPGQRIQLPAPSDAAISSLDADPYGNVVGTVVSSGWRAAGTDGRVFTVSRGSARLVPDLTGAYDALW